MNDKDWMEYLNKIKSERVTNKKNIDEFIDEHTHINYCEAIIFPSGEIAYVNPSHVETMLREFNCSRDEAYSKIPITESPLTWLIDETKCVAVWSCGYIKPRYAKLSENALISLKKLINASLVKNKHMREY